MAERLNFREACQHAGVSRQRLNQAIKNGRLPAERGGGPGKPTYISMDDLQAWCVSEGLAMPIEAVERSERSQSGEMPILMERLERLVIGLDRLERLERLERSPTQGAAPQQMTIPLERSLDVPESEAIPTHDRNAILERIIVAKDARRLSYQKIADELNAQGIPTFSGRGLWQKGSVERAYKGKTD